MKRTGTRVAVSATLAALGASALFAPAASAIDVTLFRPPGKLTYCVYFKTMGKETVRCDIKDLGDKAIFLTDKARLKMVTDTTVSDEAKVIKDGKSIRKGSFKCEYDAPKFVCTNTKSGFGFTITGKKHKFFVPAD